MQEPGTPRHAPVLPPMEKERPVPLARRRAAPPSKTIDWGRPGELLRRAAGACDRVPLSSWTRPGTPLPLLGVALWLLPFMLAGIIRYQTGLKIGVGLAVAVPVVMVLGALWWAHPRGPGAPPDGDTRLFRTAGALIGVGLVVWAFSLLYSPHLGPLALYYGSDGGTHIASRRIFAEAEPKVYSGFVTLYAATHLLDRMFSLAPPGALSLAFYSAVATVVVVPVIVMVALLQGERANRVPRLMGLAAFSVAWCGCVKAFALPLLSNMQVDGFYAHFFGFLPFALAWAADVLVRPVLLRIFWTGLTVLVCRFTYGLNLGDLLVTCGVLWAFDGVGSRRRALPFVAGAGAIAGGIAVYVSLAPVFALGGYVEVYNYVALPKIMLAGALALGAYAIVDARSAARARNWRQGPASASLGLWRAVRLPLLFTGVALVAKELFSKVPRAQGYYLLKYPLMPMAFLGAAASIAVGYTAFIMMKRWAHPLVALTAVVAIFVFGILSVEASNALAVLQRELADRTGPKPHGKLRPLVDPELWKTIEVTLQGEGKAFGGLVSADLPAAHIVDAWQGFADADQSFHAPNTTPGHCVFWTPLGEDPTFLWNPSPAKVEAARAALETDPLKICKTYDAPWTTARRTICHRCY
jgi:hypothetical protein